MHNPNHNLGLLAHPHMTIEYALLLAFNALTATGNTFDHDAATIVKAIIDQRGCGHMDTGSRGSDRLVDAISVVVFG